MTSKFFVLKSAAAIALISLGACSNTSDLGNTSTLTVGSVLSETGAAGAYGGEAAKGAELALQEFKAGSDVKFEIKYIPTDDKSDQVEATKLARTLIDLEKVDVILGPAISPSALSVGKYAEEMGVPIIGTSPTLDSVTNTDKYNRINVFRVCFNDSFQGQALASFAARDLNKKKAAIIFDSTLSYSIGLAEVFERDFEKLGGQILHKENYSVKDSDFSALVDKVKDYDVDILFIPGWDENVGPMIRQANGKWDNFILLGGDGWPTARLLELAGNDIPESYALSHFAADDPSPQVVKFVTNYKATHGAAPSPFAALGYDAMNVILDSAKRTKEFSPANLREAINSTQDLKLTTGTFSFDKYGNPKKAGTIVKISADGFTFEKHVSP